MPVVENLEDMWKVTKLQRERKKVQEKAKALAEFAELQSSESPGQQQSSHHHLPTQVGPRIDVLAFLQVSIKQAEQD